MDHLKQVKDYLNKEKVKYQILHHDPAYTAQEIAAKQHIPGAELVKSVIVKAGDEYIMCVLPAIHRIAFDRLEAALGKKGIKLASETEVGKLFPECELGAEPPFGQWHGLSVYADQILEQDEEIAFNAGTHTDLIKMRFADYKRLAHPKILRLGTHI
jgi:Ala-tRNA(Pro) deacylase